MGMKWNISFADLSPDDPVERAKAIRSCLEYVVEELDIQKLDEAALLIGAATQAVEDWLDERDPSWAIGEEDDGED